MSTPASSNVLFDLDGTMLDTAPDLAFALNTLLQEQDKEELPLTTIRPAVSLGGVAMLKLGFFLDEESKEFARLRQRFLEIYSENIARQSRFFDGMEDLLEQLDRKQIPWGIVTNKPAWLTAPLMSELGLDKRTPCIVSGDTAEHSKPHPAPMYYACKLLACSAQDTLYLGDAQRDIEAGNAADMTTVIANYGYIDNKEETGLWGADGSIDKPVELLGWLNIS